MDPTAIVSSALGQALPDGDLRTDGQLDSADALRLLQLLRSGGASAEEIAHGDVAPPETGDGGLDAGDALLLLRALTGADVDGVGLDASQERLLGTNPFRQDTDGDFTLDGEEDPNLFTGIVYRHADHLGSTALTSHADDSEVVRAVYRPFGEAVRPSAGGSAELGEFGYTGQRFEAGPALYDYGARWYDPVLGRFLQPDPIVGDPFDPQSLNRYSYVLNDPGNRVDPTGLTSLPTGFTNLAAVDATTRGGVNDVLAGIAGSGGPASQPLSNYLPQGSSSILFNAGMGGPRGASVTARGGANVVSIGPGRQAAGVTQRNGETAAVNPRASRTDGPSASPLQRIGLGIDA